MVYGVSRIALPSSDQLDGRWSQVLRSSQYSPASSPTDFVAGPENRLVVSALQRLLANSYPADFAVLFNPLVLVGATGTGKSLLVRGLTRHWQSLFEHSEVEYFTAVDFARQLRAAREDGSLEEFFDRLSALRFVVIEDFHRLPLNRFVQRQLRGLLDLLNDVGAVVIVTTQQTPTSVAGLDAGLRDRLSSGLLLALQAPGLEARTELLKLTAASRGYQISDEQLQQIAQKIEGSVPQLSRALAEYELAAKDQLSAPCSPSPVELKQIIAVVARYFSLTQAALRSPARRKSLVYARGIVIYLARSLTDLSYSQIGHALGRRDHTTIMNAIRTTEKRLANDTNAQHDVQKLKRILTAA